MKEFITIRTYNDEMEAEIVKELLNSQGVETAIVCDDVGETHPHLAVCAGVRLMVKEEMVNIAEKILKSSKK